VTDWLDVGFALPVVNLGMVGISTATIHPASGLPALHFFGGTPDAPVFTAQKSTVGSTTGVGDLAARVKMLLVRGEAADLAVLGEVRLPTGNEEDFLGTGDVNARGVFIASTTIQDFSPHMNIGYGYRGAELDQDVIEVTTGFDHRLSNSATLAVDLMGVFKIGEAKLDFPDPITIPGGFRQTVDRTNIPSERDDILDGSFGFKFRAGTNFTVVANVLVPLNDGGLRSSPIPTLGVEWGR